jgi:tetratricopeptide (TPR) repeat protein
MDKDKDKRKLVLIFGGLVLITLAAYEPVRLNGFVNFDDPVYVTDNPFVVKGLNAQSIKWAFTRAHYGTWHPVTSLSHMLDCQIFGLNPLGHHLVSLLIHTTNVLLLFWVMKRLTGGVWTSVFVAAVFAVHPLNVESVAWVSERKSVLSGLFWFLTILAYIRYAEQPNSDRYSILLLVFCLGLMSKPVLVMLPLVLILLDFWPMGRFKLARSSEAEASSVEKVESKYKKIQSKQLILEKVPLFVLSVIVALISLHTQRSAGMVASGAVLNLKVRMVNVPAAYMDYLNKMVYPVDLSVFYPFQSEMLQGWFADVLKLLVITAVVVYFLRTRRYPFVGWFWYLIVLLPVIGLIQVGSQSMADRYAYLPLIGIFIIIAYGAVELSAKWRDREKVLAVASGIILVLLVGLCRAQVKYWRDSISLFEHSVRVVPNNYRMYNNYGDSLMKAGRFEEAEKQFRKTLEINPGYIAASYNLGLALGELKRYDEAIEQFGLVVEKKPDWYLVRVCLADAYYRKGDISRCYEVMADAIEYANKAGRVGMAERLGKRLELYKQKQEVPAAAEMTDSNSP